MDSLWLVCWVSDSIGTRRHAGLSYTQFQYRDVQLNATTIGPCDVLGLSVRITNIGHVDGDEVVQVYVKQPNASVPVPLVRLAAFDRIFVPAKKTVSVKFSIVPESHAAVIHNGFDNIYDGVDSVVVEAGPLELFVGGQQPQQIESSDPRLSAQNGELKARAFVTSGATIVSCGL